MKKISIARAIARTMTAGMLLGGVGVLASCGDGPEGSASDEASDTGQALSALPALVSAGDSDTDEARALWLAMADDPLHHVRLAHDLVAEGNGEDAARQLDMSAYLFRWGHLYAHGMGERRDFVATAQQLEAAARGLRTGREEDPAVLDRTLAGGLRAMADLHATEVMGEWKSGEHSRAALLLHASADEVRCGFSLSGMTPGGTIERVLADAGTVADRLDSHSPPDEGEVRDAIEGLRDSAKSLADVLSSRPA